MSASMDPPLDFAAPKLGSGARFRKLSATLAARGAKNPDALAAYIGQKKYGAKKMGRLAAHSHANDDLGIYLADGPAPYHRDADENVRCPSCQKYNAEDARYCDQCGDKLPASAYADLANTTAATELTQGTQARRHPVQGPEDVIPIRQPDGTALLRHRNGGTEIARIRQSGDGRYVATVNGKDLPARTIQKAALMEAVGTYNSSLRPQAAPSQVPPQHAEPAAEYGIPAVRALATPATSSSGGPRVTSKSDPGNDGNNDASPSGDTDKDGPGGLSPKAQQIYKKLIGRGFPPARALAFAKNSAKFGAKAAA